MPTTFYRLSTDLTRSDVPLEGLFAGPIPSACFLVGGGPSLTRLPVAGIAAAPVPKMCVNLSGTRLVRPTFWTSYDPSARFHRSVYLDAGVMKFVHRRRAMDLVPETSFKVCDCPNTYFFDRDGGRGFADSLSPASTGIVDWADSMVQAIDILYRLGFRVVYLAGCEMRVRPSKEQIERGAAFGVRYDPRGLLRDFLRQCEAAGLLAEQLDSLPPGRHYHFDEHKPIRAAANTDFHYFRISQYLRLSRRSLSLAGMQLVSVTPHSRLNDYFRYTPARQALRRIEREIGDPQTEPVRGLYGRTAPRHRRTLDPMRDFRPHHWLPDGKPAANTVPVNGRCRPTIRDGEFLVEAEGVEFRPLETGDGRNVEGRLAARQALLPEREFDICEDG